MPVIKGTHGWYTDAEIKNGVPSPAMAEGLPPNTPQWWDMLLKPGKYTGTGPQSYFAEVAETLPDTGRWCDVGCGLGEFMAYVATRKPELEAWGWDISPAAIEHARKRPGLVPSRLAVGTLPAHIPWPAMPLDVVTVLEVLEHFPITAAPKIIAVTATLAPLTIYTVPNGMDFASGHFVWYDLNLFRSMLPAGCSATGQLLPSDKWMFVVTKNA